MSKSSTAPPPSAIVVMGPSGCGKTTLGRALAAALGWRFVEGDEHHSVENRAKMSAGEPLSEGERLPFLKGVGRALASGAPAVASCSALRRSHRDVLRSFAGEILFVLPEPTPAELTQRVRSRTGHFMPPELLESQLTLLERPAADERCLTLACGLSTEEQIEAVLRYLHD